MSGEGLPDLEGEVGRVSESLASAFDDLVLVVHAFEPTGMDRVAGVGDDPAPVAPESAQGPDLPEVVPDHAPS